MNILLFHFLATTFGGKINEPFRFENVLGLTNKFLYDDFNKKI